MELAVLTPFGGEIQLTAPPPNLYVGSRVLGSIVTDSSRALDGSASKDLSPARATWPGLAVGFSDGGKCAGTYQEIRTRAADPTERLDVPRLPPHGTRLHDLIRKGLPFEYLNRIASLQMQRGVIATTICVSPQRWHEARKQDDSTP